MTRSVEIPEAARKAAAKRLAEFGAWPDGPHAAWMTESDALRFADAALEAALPYLAPALPAKAELAAWLREIFVTDADPEGTTWDVAAEELLRLIGQLYPAPAGDGGLREALEKLLARKVEQSNGVDTEWSTVTVRQLRELLAAPAVPQPVDREALSKAVYEKSTAVVLEGGYITTLIAPEDAVSAVLAVLAGEQEQVEK